MKRCFALIVFLNLVFLCFSEIKTFNSAYIELTEGKLYLRYTNRNQVEAVLGKPAKTRYFEKSLEDFFWNNFYVCDYDNGNLVFHYDSQGNIIRITTSPNFSNSITIPEGVLSKINKKIIEEKIQSITIKDLINTKNFLSYFYYELPQIPICYSYWFAEDGRVKWYDMYYVKPWY